jgi:hypothetical protein
MYLSCPAVGLCPTYPPTCALPHPLYAHRLGAKAWTSHLGGQDNSVEHALILQQVMTVDEQVRLYVGS